MPAQGCCVTDPFETRLQWLRDTIGIGVVAGRSVDILYQSSYASFLSSGGLTGLADETADWALTCAAAHYWWPPPASEPSEVLTFPASDLVHEVGLHWYHGYNRKYDGDSLEEVEWTPGYQDAIRLQSDLDRLESVVVVGLQNQGFTLTRSAGEVAFAGLFPDAKLTRPLTAPYYTDTNTLFQAGMLARFLFQFRTAGVSRMSWFCPLLNPLNAEHGTLDGVAIPSNWSSAVSGTGLHNDISLPGQYPTFASQGAWRRPAWFTYRRVAWLLSLAENEGSLEYNARGLTVLRYRLRTPLSFHPLTSPGYRFLWVAWLDQYSDSECLHGAYRPAYEAEPDDPAGFDDVSIILHDSGGRGYERVSLVPSVAESEVEDEVDANGYRQVTARDWFWEGWDGALTDHYEWSDDSRPDTLVVLGLRKTGTDIAQAPVAVLTDADKFLGPW